MLLQAGQKLAHWFLADLFNNILGMFQTKRLTFPEVPVLLRFIFINHPIWGAKVNRSNTKQGFQAEVVLLVERRMNYLLLKETQ